MQKGYWLVALVFSLVMTAAGNVGAVQYRIVDLGTLDGGNESHATGINDNGQVVGWSWRGLDSADYHAFLWTSETGMQDLGALSGNQYGSWSKAYGINNSGQVVGWTWFGSGGEYPFLWNSTTGMQSIGSLSSMGAAASINNQGQIVGYTEFQAGPGDTAFLWDSNNGLKNLTVLSGAVRFSGGGDINNSGQIPGSMVSDALGGWEACVWNAANDIRGLGILGSADYINDNGHVLGTTISGDVFLWDSSSGVHDLGFQYTPTGLNNNGQVVGYVAGTSSDGGHEADRAFVWDSTNGLTILGNLGDNSQAECVNNAGWIVGTYNGQAVLWEPVPEMSSMTGLLGGLAGFGMVWRRRNEYRRREVE